MSEETTDQPVLTEFESLRESWQSLSSEERKERFYRLAREDAEELFLGLSAADQAEMLAELSPQQKRSWVRLLAPDDAADLFQQLSPENRYEALSLLDEQTRREVTGLLAYAEDDAGGLMSSRYLRLRPDMSVEEAIRYVRAQAKTPVETIYFAYVQDTEQHLLGVVSFRELFLAPASTIVRDIMKTDLVTIPEDMDQEEVSRLFSEHDLLAIPVVDSENRMKGIITFDDVVQVVKEEATEDIQKIGGVEALEAPYLQTSLIQMLKKRAPWLTVLFLGEMFTATAMSHFEVDIEKAVVLALFIPLIISSGGNSGSQASTLIIRALALQEVKLRDWWKVFLRELTAGSILGLLLGLIGFFRVTFWQVDPAYADHYARIGLTVAFSLTGVVLWGALAGSMLPFLLRRLKLDPAVASAPLVATLVDVTGLVMYFSLAKLFLSGLIL